MPEDASKVSGYDNEYFIKIFTEQTDQKEIEAKKTAEVIIKMLQTTEGDLKVLDVGSSNGLFGKNIVKYINDDKSADSSRLVINRVDEDFGSGKSRLYNMYTTGDSANDNNLEIPIERWLKAHSTQEKLKKYDIVIFSHVRYFLSDELVSTILSHINDEAIVIDIHTSIFSLHNIMRSIIHGAIDNGEPYDCAHKLLNAQKDAEIALSQDIVEAWRKSAEISRVDIKGTVDEQCQDKQHHERLAITNDIFKVFSKDKTDNSKSFGKTIKALSNVIAKKFHVVSSALITSKLNLIDKYGNAIEQMQSFIFAANKNDVLTKLKAIDIKNADEVIEYLWTLKEIKMNSLFQVITKSKLESPPIESHAYDREKNYIDSYLFDLDQNCGFLVEYIQKNIHLIVDKYRYDATSEFDPNILQNSGLYQYFEAISNSYTYANYYINIIQKRIISEIAKYNHQEPRLAEGSSVNSKNMISAALNNVGVQCYKVVFCCNTRDKSYSKAESTTYIEVREYKLHDINIRFSYDLVFFCCHENSDVLLNFVYDYIDQHDTINQITDSTAMAFNVNLQCLFNKNAAILEELITDGNLKHLKYFTSFYPQNKASNHDSKIKQPEELENITEDITDYSADDENFLLQEQMLSKKNKNHKKTGIRIRTNNFSTDTSQENSQENSVCTGSSVEFAPRYSSQDTIKSVSEGIENSDLESNIDAISEDIEVSFQDYEEAKPQDFSSGASYGYSSSSKASPLVATKKSDEKFTIRRFSINSEPSDKETTSDRSMKSLSERCSHSESSASESNHSRRESIQVNYLTTIIYDNPILNNPKILALIDKASLLGQDSVDILFNTIEAQPKSIDLIAQAVTRLGTKEVISILRAATNAVYLPKKSTKDSMHLLDSYDDPHIARSINLAHTKEYSEHSVFKFWNYGISHADINKLEDIATIFGFDESLKKALNNKQETNKYFRHLLAKLHTDTEGGSKDDFQFVNNIRDKLNNSDEMNNSIELNSKHQYNNWLYRASIGINIADAVVDIINLYQEPTLYHAKEVLNGGIYVTSLYYGFSSASVVTSSISVAFAYYENGAEAAIKQGLVSIAFMSALAALAYTGLPYAGVVFLGGVMFYSACNLAANAYSSYNDMYSNEGKMKSYTAYQNLYRCASDFSGFKFLAKKSEEYTAKIHLLSIDLETNAFKEKCLTYSNICKEVFKYIYEPIFEKKVSLLSSVIEGKSHIDTYENFLLEDAFVRFDGLEYDICSKDSKEEIDNKADTYYCYNKEDDNLDKITITPEGIIESEVIVVGV